MTINTFAFYNANITEFPRYFSLFRTSILISGSLYFSIVKILQEICIWFKFAIWYFAAILRTKKTDFLRTWKLRLAVLSLFSVLPFSLSGCTWNALERNIYFPRLLSLRIKRENVTSLRTPTSHVQHFAVVMRVPLQFVTSNNARTPARFSWCIS